MYFSEMHGVGRVNYTNWVDHQFDFFQSIYSFLFCIFQNFIIRITDLFEAEISGGKMHIEFYNLVFLPFPPFAFQKSVLKKLNFYFHTSL